MAIVELMMDLKISKNYYISFSCKDSEHISNGETFKESYEAVTKAANERLIAVGINWFYHSSFNNSIHFYF